MKKNNIKLAIIVILVVVIIFEAFLIFSKKSEAPAKEGEIQYDGEPIETDL